MGGFLFGGLSDIGTLDGLNSTAFAILAGQAGGQTLQGGTAANEDLTLEGTAHGTKATSYVLLQPTAGNVGIGTTAPGGQIHLGLTENTGAKSYNVNTAGQGLIINAYDPGASIGYQRQVDFVALGAQDGSAGGATFRFLTNPKDSADAYNGVSIVPPQGGYAGLKLNKASADTGNMLSTSYWIEGAMKWAAGIDVANDDYVIAYDASILGDVFRIAPGGKTVLGPGIGSPLSETYRLTLKSNLASGTADGMTLANANSGVMVDFLQSYAATIFGVSTYTGGGLGTRTNHPLLLATNNIARVVIDVAGNVGIGTTAPGAPLTVDGITGVPATTGTAQGGIFRIGTALGTRSNVLDFGKYFDAPYGIWLQCTDASDLSSRYPIILQPSGGMVGIGTVAPAAMLHVDQSSTVNAIPVLTLDQADVSEPFIKFIGESTTDNSQSLIDAANLATAGAIVGWAKVYVEDVQGTGPITDGVYWIPFYATPTA